MKPLLKSIFLLLIVYISLGLTSVLAQETELSGMSSAISGQNDLIENSVGSVDLNKGLIAHYPFNGNAKDVSGNEHHGTANGAVPAIDRLGNSDSAFTFNGEKNTLTFSGSQLEGPEFTVSLWLKVTDPDVDTVFICTSSLLKILVRVADHKNHEVIYHNYRVEFTVGNKTVALQDYFSDLIDPQYPRYDYINIYYNGSLVYFLVNNEMRGALYLNDMIPNEIFPFTFKNNVTYSLKGTIDDLRIYNRILNDQERNMLNIDRQVTLPAIKLSITKIRKDFADYYSIIKYDGGSYLREEGICLSTTPGPDTSDRAEFKLREDDYPTGRILNLLPNTIYYVRAFARNNAGIGYSNELKFTTLNENVFGSITDVEGNVYKTIQIGIYNWTTENLRTTKYNDGTDIPNITDNIEWRESTYGAYCWYNNDMSGNKNTYGALYNYMAVTNDQKLCPTGWSVPTAEEWESLPCNRYWPPSEPGPTFCFGPCEELKEVGREYWKNGTNETGFSGLPGGVRQTLDFPKPLGFKGKGWAGFFWTSNGDFFELSSCDMVGYEEWYNTSLQDGHSVRCIEDSSISKITTEDQNVSLYTSFEIPILVQNMPKGEITYYQFDMDVDAEKIQYQNYIIDKTLSSYGSINIDHKENKLTVTWNGLVPLDQSGVLITLVFKAVETGNVSPVISNFILSSGEFPRASYAKVSYLNNFSNGKITIRLAGDVDDNENIQSLDAALALRYSVGFDPLPDMDPLPWVEWRYETTNVDGEADISAYDASLILQYIMGIINSFPSQKDYLEGTEKSQSDVNVVIENGNMVFRSSGDVKGLNVAMRENSELFGLPESPVAGALLASNYTSTNVSVGLAMANAPAENEVILTIPVIGIPENPVVLNLLINNREKKINIGILTGISETFQKTIEIYPNPANTLLYFKNLPENSSISIFDLNGRKIRSVKPTEDHIDISDLAFGLYNFRIEFDNNILIKKLVKQ